jgi:hypothetical protein
MQRHVVRTALAVLLVAGATSSAGAQGAPSPTGRLSVFVDTSSRRPTAGNGDPTRAVELWTAATFESADKGEGSGVDFRFDGRHSRTVQGLRPPRVSIYDAYVGGHVGSAIQLKVRAGQMWLQDLGTIGALAGGLVEVGQPRSAEGTRFRVGGFAGREPTNYDVGFVPNVRKMGGYAAIESGFLRRHVVGYTKVSQGALTERSVVSITNLVPAGRNFFAYQAAEYEVRGPAQGTAPGGLSYFLANVRANTGRRVELTGTYNRGRSLDARTLTTDLLSGRALSAQAVEGLKYESRGGRISVEVARGLRTYASYTQDRNNRDDDLTGRVTLGGYASNLGRSGLDVSASNSRTNRATGAYHSTFVSVGRAVSRSLYVSADYTTSLSVVQFQRGDGILIETRPWTKRYSTSLNANLNRHLSLSVTGDLTRDATLNEVRVLSGLSYRFP